MESQKPDRSGALGPKISKDLEWYYCWVKVERVSRRLAKVRKTRNTLRCLLIAGHPVLLRRAGYRTGFAGKYDVRAEGNAEPLFRPKGSVRTGPKQS